MSKSFTLPSGTILEVTLAPFTDGRALYQAMLEEAKGLRLDPGAEVDVNLWKDLFCMALASKKVEEALWACMGRATYGKLKITLDTFEPEVARGDYLDVMMHVATENISPFTKSLHAKLLGVMEQLKGLSALASKSEVKSA